MAEIVTAQELTNKIGYLRSQKKDLVVVATNGCFDLLHIGHIRSLQKAKSLGDVLVVGINSDSSVKTIKGPNRPINNENHRAEVLAALASVDFVTIFPESTANKFLETLKPNIYVKGSEYNSNDLPEASMINKLGGKIIQIPMVPEASTTNIIERIKTLDC